jgi:xanthine dehydrogenase accessory factor
VVREAIRALADGEPRLVRIGPPGSHEDTLEDVVKAESMCASEGTVEVLIEPQLPAPLLAVLGDGPAAHVLADLAGTIGWRVATDLPSDADAVVIATMGHGDEDALAAALGLPIGYIGLVASARRAAAVLAALRERGVGEEALARIRSPAGLDLGPSSQPEIAVAVLAELVAWRHTRGEVPTPPAEAVDPVCGMTVAIEGAKETAVYEGVTYYFCGAHCRRRFEADPAQFVGIETPG